MFECLFFLFLALHVHSLLALFFAMVSSIPSFISVVKLFTSASFVIYSIHVDPMSKRPQNGHGGQKSGHGGQKNGHGGWDKNRGRVLEGSLGGGLVCIFYVYS